MKKTSSFTSECVKENQEIIIYGAGVYGEIAYYGLKIWGLKATCFCDMSFNKKNMIYGVPVISPDELVKHKEACIILASYNYYGEMFQKCILCGCRYIYDMECLLQLDYRTKPLSGRALGRVNDLLGYKQMLESANNKKQIYLNHIDFVVCENCTLRCKDCSNLMQYYDMPEVLKDSLYIEALERCIETVDYVGEIYLLGGEPFLHKNLHEIIYRLKENKKIGGITIFSNGTVVPNDETLTSIKECNVALQISNYGINESELIILIDILNEWNIKYVIKKYDTWIDLGGVEERNFEFDTIKENSETCFFRKTYTMHRGRLFRCPRSAHGSYLKCFEIDEDDYVDFISEKFDFKRKREELIGFLEKKSPYKSCFHCNGGSLLSKTIPAAIQKESR